MEPHFFPQTLAPKAAIWHQGRHSMWPCWGKAAALLAFRCGAGKSATIGHGIGHGTWHCTLQRRRWRPGPLFGAKVGIACGHAGAKRRRCCPFERVLERAGTDEVAGLENFGTKIYRGNGKWHWTIICRRWCPEPLFGAEVGMAYAHVGAKRRRCWLFGAA